MKSDAKTKPTPAKKNMNITANVAEALKKYNKKTQWKNKTAKLISTLTAKTITSKPNVMTEEDIEKLFSNHTKDKLSEVPPTKVSTEVDDCGPYIRRKDFVECVNFLKLDDETDRLLSGLPEEGFNQFYQDCGYGVREQAEDLTVSFKKNYLVGKIIGEGAYASVRVAVYKPQQLKVALKIYEKAKIKDLQRKKSVRREIKILQLLTHPNIVRIHDVVETNNHLNISMQYLSGLSLGTYLKAQPSGKIPEKTCKKIFKQLAHALAYMHRLNISHRDIKLENIILDDNLSPKLIDFGFSTCIEPTQRVRMFCGTPSYMAPEVVQRKQYRGETADIWALGVLLFVALTGVFPFKGATDQQLFKKISESDYPKSQLLYTRSAAELISRMLRVNSEQRIKAHEMLCHSWFSQGRGDSSKKRNTETSQEGRRRIYTINSNQENQMFQKAKSKENAKPVLQKSGKKILAETCKQNLNLEIRLALRSPTNKQITSFRKKKEDKQNMKLSFKHEKTLNAALLRQTLTKQLTKQGEAARKKDKLLKTQPKVIELLRMEMKKKQNQKSKSKSNTHRN